ncbi:MAG: hypothetical protein IPI67_17755 [Myxococcales bacterium]|nr:hypothetical protein [Myxococcales bacterium]
MSRPGRSCGVWLVGLCLTGVSLTGCGGGEKTEARGRTAAGNTFPAVVLPDSCDGVAPAECARVVARRADSAAAATELSRLRSRFRTLMAAPGAEPRSITAIGTAEVDRVEASSVHPGALRAVVPVPELSRGGWSLGVSPVQVEFPVAASGATRVIDKSGVEVAFRLREAAATEIKVGGGVALYPGAYRGGHIVQRASFTGVEDFVVFEQKPAIEALHYQIDVSRVPGLRLVDDVLELLDADGAPRLRVNQPFLVTESGKRVAARLSLTGCAYDSSPLPPWRRPVTAPGTASCELVVRWSDVSYPALVDPAWESGSIGASAHYDHDAFVLPGTSGLIMAAAGVYWTCTPQSLCDTAQNNSELFDPATKTFSTKKFFVWPLIRARCAQRHRRLGGGRWRRQREE